MNIPQTSIDPFGYTGMPIPVDLAHEYKYAIMDAIMNYIRAVDRISCYFSDGSITASVLDIVDHHGAITPIIKHRRNTNYNRVFTLEYSIPNYSRRQTFGFAVKQK